MRRCTRTSASAVDCRRLSWSASWSLFLLVIVLLTTNNNNYWVNAQTDNLYQILGVTKKSTTQEIKRAYRKKALDTHPDKNPNVPVDEATAIFHKVVQAFEVLSDSNSRSYYDRTGRLPNENGGGSGGGGGGFQQQQQYRRQSSNTFTYSFNRRQPIKLKDKPEVKQAQARLMHIVSLEQFETVLLDDDGMYLDRHVLLAAVNPNLEKYVMEEMVFPFPFAGMSPQHIWWEDVLQTVLIRYHNKNDLTQMLNLPKGSDLNKPVFLFGKKGQRMDEGWARTITTSREQLESWVWEQLEVEIQFVNHHDHPVEIYWIDGTRAKIKIPKLEPGETTSLSTRLTHEWYVRDCRVDTRSDSPGRWKLTEESTLVRFQVTNPKSIFVMNIPKRDCYDLSGHCQYWKGGNQCQANPRFMKEQCPLTCNNCSDEQDQVWVEQAKNGTYQPPGGSISDQDEQQQSVQDEL
eukprot:CAMPEP_0198148542 /NCGR_PEP_ID=MMETSP1443-20131203/41864_1 /TAXON_ID=186043 /ORGANISM="Entomoneis sp., Strain CCMP2396" /LENGTH=460 /DNA_ID=CAMNT_0043813251 /DNA_START=157 /DNA_END=1539 /DNA_ORIENTATION=+